MKIILIRWFIKPGKEDDFFAFWKEVAKINNRDGFAFEFLSEPFAGAENKMKTWNLSDGEAIIFVNVGVWENVAAFEREIGNNIEDEKLPRDWEVKRPERIVLEPLHYRVNRPSKILPEEDSTGVI